MTETQNRVPSISAGARYAILGAAFLGWMFSGVQMALMPLAAGSATKEFFQRGVLDTDHYVWIPNLWRFDADRSNDSPREGRDGAALEVNKAILKVQIPKWFALYGSLFLFGAAVGGLVFGWLGDRVGRVKAMASSILCFSFFAGAAYFVLNAEQLLLCRFLSGLGVGGMWPTGVSLAAEAWPDASRPKLSGLLGASANVGIAAVNFLALFVIVTPDSWRWLFILGTPPVLLGLLVILFVQESPSWLAARANPTAQNSGSTVGVLFRPPLLSVTLIGIALGTIPLLGGWGVTSWLILWTEDVHGAADPHKKALTALMRSMGGALGSLFGGWMAHQIGRRRSYFLISLSSLVLSEFIYLFMHPKMAGFGAMVFVVGCVSTIFFGWLPLCLPELFPTHARATGAGISFNFGRILTAFGVLGTGWLLTYFGNFSQAGSIMSLVYALGMIVILLAPDTSQKKLGDQP